MSGRATGSSLPPGRDLFAPLPGRPIEERHLVAAVEYAAYIVVRYGDKYAPIFESLERDLFELRNKRSPAERARRMLEAHTTPGTLKAIA